MVSAGIASDPQCVTDHLDLVQRKKYDFVIFKIDGEKVVTDTKADAVKVDSSREAAQFKEDIFPKFYEAITACKEPRFASLDFRFETKDGGKRSKVVFVWWSPDNAPIKSKMVYSSTQNEFKDKLGKYGGFIQATDASECSYETILDEVQ